MIASNTTRRDKTCCPSPSLEQHVLAHSQSSREVIQDYCPLAESLEWELGQQYFRERGNKAFIGDTIPVPFLINNDGTLSRNAAEVFFTSCVEAETRQASIRRRGLHMDCGGATEAVGTHRRVGDLERAWANKHARAGRSNCLGEIELQNDADIKAHSKAAKRTQFSGPFLDLRFWP